MKNKYIFIISALVAAALASCAQKEGPAFADSSSARMEKFLDHVQDVISHPKNGFGWYMAYFTDQDKTAGGTVYTIQFDKPGAGEATIFHEDVTPAEGWGNTCRYKLTKDDGPVLSFDTYNVAMHYYSTSLPSQAYYESMGGDFEFEVFNACPDSVVMRGKRTRCIYKMYPLEKEGEEFMSEIKAMDMALTVGQTEAEITGGLVQMELDLNRRTITIGRKDASDEEKVSVPYIITPTGFKLYETLDFQGVKFKDFVFDADAMTLTSNGTTFSMVIPEGYMPYNRYLGKYVLKTGELGDFNVEIVEDVFNRSYKMKGLNSKFEVALVYNAGQGAINWLSQSVGKTEDNHDIWLCAWAKLNNQDGYFTWDPTIGMRSVVDDPEADAFVLKMKDLGGFDSGTVDSFILCDYTATMAASQAVVAPSSWYFPGGNYALYGPFTFTKKVE